MTDENGERATRYSDVPLVDFFWHYTEADPDEVITVWFAGLACSGLVEKAHNEVWVIFAAHADRMGRTKIVPTFFDPACIVGFCRATDCPDEDRKLMFEAREAWQGKRDATALPAPPPAPSPGALTEDELRALGLL